MKSFFAFLTVAVLGFLLGGEIAIWHAHHRASFAPPKFAESGAVTSMPEPGSKAHIGGPFSLVDQTGRAVTQNAWPGKYKLVYFGYTHCTDTCPATLQKIDGVMQKLGSQEAAKIVPLFITVDPMRDTVVVMARYLSRFHSPYLVGLTGTADEIASVEKAYHVYAGGKGSLESHSDYVYLMSPDDKLVTVFDPGTAPSAMLAEIIGYVK